MRDSKAFASLSSGLLARKGQARPAMRPQGFATSLGAQDDLGWDRPIAQDQAVVVDVVDELLLLGSRDLGRQISERGLNPRLRLLFWF